MKKATPLTSSKKASSAVIKKTTPKAAKKTIPRTAKKNKKTSSGITKKIASVPAKKTIPTKTKKAVSPPTKKVVPTAIKEEEISAIPQAPPVVISKTPPAETKKETPMVTQKSNIRHIIFSTLVAVPAIIFWMVFLIASLGIASVMLDDDEYCNVARIPVQGVLMATDNGLADLLGFGAITSADSIIESIQAAEDDDMITAIVVDIDSPGGTPVAGDEIMTALATTQKPTVAVVRDRGASAAYWAAAGADYIIASPVSDVGSIGVTMSYLEFASSTDMEGTRWIDLSSGLFKDAGHPERALREDEEEHFQIQVDAVHEYMVDQIASVRHALTRDELAALADGRAYVGAQAVDLKLIDELGGFAEAGAYMANILQVSEDSLSLCEVQGGSLGDLLR